MKKRVFSLWLCLTMCLIMVPATAWAEEPAGAEAPVEVEISAEEATSMEVEVVVEVGAPAEQTEEPDSPGRILGNSGGVAIDAENFPDEVFRAYVSETFDYDVDGVLSEDEISEVTGIYVNDLGISSLQGIEFFPALESLDCNHNTLTSLDVSANTALTWLDCGSNRLTELDVHANTALTELTCRVNRLTALDVSSNTALTVLDCAVNFIPELDVRANTALTILNCNQNDLHALDVSANTALTELYFAAPNQGRGGITDIDLRNNTALTALACAENPLNGLDLSANTELTYLECTNCGLTELDLGVCPHLVSVYCAENELTELNLSKNTELESIECDGNDLTELDVSCCPMLDFLFCGINQLTELDLSKNPALVQLACPYNHLTSLDLSGHAALCKLYCNDNEMTELDIRDTQICTDKLNHGFFGFDSDESGESVITVFMTSEQKTGFDACFVNEMRNKGVTVIVEKPVINTQPADYRGEVGTTATFTVAASGNGLSYQWQYCDAGTDVWKDSDLNGSDTETLKVPIIKARNGQKFRCKVTDCYGEIQESEAATLTVKSSSNERSESTKTSATFSRNWYKDDSGAWRIRNSAGQVVVDAWLCDDVISANGKNVWYLLTQDGAMAAAGLVQDNTGNFYSLETEHNGYFGMLRYQDGTYNCNGQLVYLTFNRQHNGSFGAITNADGLEKLKAIYGITQYGIGNENTVYTSVF